MRTDDTLRGENPLQAALSELSALVVAEETTESVLNRVVELAKQVVTGADEVSLTLFSPGGPATVASTGPLATALDERQYETDTGPCLQAARQGEVVHVPDARVEERWPEYTRVALDHGALSSLSSPIAIQPYAAAGLNIYGTRAGAFDEQDREIAEAFCAAAAVALTNVHLYDSSRRLATNLETAMQSRAVIEQAKGILMAQRSCSADRAFQLMTAASQRSNRKLRDIAQSIVDSTQRPARPPG